MKQSSLRSNLMLMTAAFIWGVAFVAQRVGMDYVGPFTFLMSRSYLGGLFLIPCTYLFKSNDESDDKRTLFTGGVCCGFILFVASILQQYGIQYTSVGKGGFLTTLYIILVPILGVFMNKKITKNVWMGVGIALIGLYLLCMKDSFSIELGDGLIILSAFCFALHIMSIDFFSPKVNPVKLSCIQFFVCAILATPFSLFVEKPEISNIAAAWIPICFAGFLSSGIAYTLQIAGQKNNDPTRASLIMSLESVFSVLAGWIILKQYLTVRELSGCALVFMAVILVQIPERKLVLDK